MNTLKKNRLPLIRYTDRDAQSIKRNLNEYRRRYYSNISKDENEASFDDMTLDLLSIIGDQINFYSDYGVNESFIQTAVEYNNVVKHGEPFGYKFRGNPSSFGVQTFYAVIPANTTGLGPDPRYLFTLKKGTKLLSTAGNGFLLNEDVKFSDSSNEVVVARVDESTGIPTGYAVKTQGQIISGRLVEEIIEIGDFQKFLKIELAGTDISEIISVVDEEGNEFFEVDFLSQDVIYKEVTNRGANSDTVQSLLKPFLVPRRFVVKRERVSTFLQFGFGSENDVRSDPLIDPAEVVLDIFGKDHVVDVSFDPANLLGTDKLGIAPANTRLRIVYRQNSSDNANASVDTITEVAEPIVEFDNISSLSIDLVRSVVDSIETTNEKNISGDVTVPTVDELKIRILDTFPTQNRAVTNQDYKAFTYKMPPKFGAIKRVSVRADPDSFKRNLNMWVISEDSDGTLIETNQTIKRNLKTWIQSGKMMNDTIDILDLKIVNLGINFVVIGEEETNKFDILNNALIRLRDNYETHFDAGEPFSIAKVRDILNKTDGVVDVISVQIYQKRGGEYSDIRYDVDSMISADGRFIDAPINVIYEIKRPDQDIKGAVK